MTITNNEMAREDSSASAPESGGRPPGRRSWTAVGVSTTLLACFTVALFLPLPSITIGVLAICTMLTLMFLRVPVAVAMIVPSLIAMYNLRGPRAATGALGSLPFDAIASWTLSVVPMFVLMGMLLSQSGVASSVYSAARQWLGWLPGGLAVGTTGAGAGLAAVSGSSVATTYTLTKIGVPEMLRAGYDKRLALGAVMVAGLPGQLIPPSILLIIYAGVAEVPVGKQLLAGLGPGLVVAVLFALIIIAVVAVTPRLAGSREVQSPEVTWKSRFASLIPTWPIPALIAIIVVGMFTGVVTATEAGAFAALFAIVVLVVNTRHTNTTWRQLSAACTGTVSTVGAIFLLLIGVEMLSRMMALTGISTKFSDVITSWDLSRVEFLLLMTVVYLVLGAFMESLPMILLTVPILIPTLTALDISLLWFGAFVVLMGEIAMLTPPVGILSMIVYAIVRDPSVNMGQKITIRDVFVSVGWFLPGAAVVVGVLIAFPEISTWLPDRGSG
ncbi:TRAP transporter large permease [Gordonia sp. KTR9]|uniref:TRAP transporter large permease n=1 Tax=Gordonia sp. KTR9 TaxID=337191 RepID=UPI00027DDEA6|nr:TRAP transporter large permease [Gordonia sp. KTR9]AFR49473.1 TRAP-type C4-dicarboxylate transport system, large permease component [Gordonia sp. KTR9]